MFDVVWVETAVFRLADAWTKSDSLRRAEITAATNRIDETLQAKPLEAGESRDEDRRIYIDLPLVVTYEIDPQRNLVTVLEVLVSRKRGSDST